MSARLPIRRFLSPAAAGCTAALLAAGAPILSVPVAAQGASARGSYTNGISSNGIASNGISRRAQTSIDCTVYGAGYVVVTGTTRCIRIRGRMRVRQTDSGYRGANYLPYASGSNARLPANLQPGPAARGWSR